MPAPRGSERSGAGAGRPARERAYESGRLARAVQRPIKKLGPGQYAVKGNVERVYYVDLSQDPPCQCLDSTYRQVQCLHTLAARLQERDPALVAALVERYERQLKILRDAGLED